MKANKTLSTMKILDSQNQALAEHLLADDWRMGIEEGHTVLNIPALFQTLGQLDNIAALILSGSTISIQIGKIKFPDFVIKEIIYSSLIDESESIPDHIATIRAVSKEATTKEKLQEWFN